MKVEVNGISYHVELFNENCKKVIVFLHGFTGSTKTWESIVPYFNGYKVILVDLIGHGMTESPSDRFRYSMQKQLDDLHSLFRKLNLENIILAGYSMGGRTALAYACTYPDTVCMLILESASPGLKAKEERASRRKHDEKLAEQIEKEGIQAFTDYWQNIALFSTQQKLPEARRRTIREERLNQSEAGLSGSLRGMGTGAQSSYWEKLQQLSFPVLLVTGTDDKKFTQIAEKMKQLLPSAVHIKIEAGHAIHVEKPEEFATMVMQQLNNQV